MKSKPKAALRFDAYAIVSRAVEEGAGYGWHRAHKYAEKPTREGAVEAIHNEIMAALSEVLVWGD